MIGWPKVDRTGLSRKGAHCVSLTAQVMPRKDTTYNIGWDFREGCFFAEDDNQEIARLSREASLRLLEYIRSADSG